MTPEEVKPFVRHWVEVYMGYDAVPTYRGTFFCGDGERFAVNGHCDADDAMPTERGQRLLVSEICKLVALKDPDWLVESNRSATIVSAKALIQRGNDASR